MQDGNDRMTLNVAQLPTRRDGEAYITANGASQRPDRGMNAAGIARAYLMRVSGLFYDGL